MNCSPRWPRILAGFLPVLFLAACATDPVRDAAGPEVAAMRVTIHRDGDDLLTGGLGHAGLVGAPPAVADPEHPTAAELRRRALYVNWRGIVDLVGTVRELPPVPGREFSAYRQVPGARFPHRVLVQVPDAFDRRNPCLVVTASSGSRGIYGAIGSAGHYALTRGCAVAYTDKGAGTDWFDPATGEGFGPDGTLATEPGGMAFSAPAAGAPFVAIKHAHSGDNPEADWGRHVLQAAAFGREVLSGLPELALASEDIRVLAFGLSNGGAAVLRAAEQDEDGLINAVVAAAPNIHVPGQRPLFDLALDAAILQPCLLLDGSPPAFVPEAVWKAQAERRCRSLAALGLIEGDTLPAQARSARERMVAAGFSEAAQRWAGLNSAFDLWRNVLAPYATAYARAGVDTPVCGYRFAAIDAAGNPRATTRAERALWWSDASGIAPSAGIQVIDTMASGEDPALPALRCLHALRQSSEPGTAATLREGIAATQATARPNVPVVIVHGSDDSLIPMANTGLAYVQAARRNGVTAIAFHEVARAQHFDAFVALPAMAGQVQPLLPHAFAAADAVRASWAGAPFPGDRTIP